MPSRSGRPRPRRRRRPRHRLATRRTPPPFCSPRPAAPRARRCATAGATGAGKPLGGGSGPERERKDVQIRERQLARRAPALRRGLRRSRPESRRSRRRQARARCIARAEPLERGRISSTRIPMPAHPPQQPVRSRLQRRVDVRREVPRRRREQLHELGVELRSPRSTTAESASRATRERAASSARRATCRCRAPYVPM